MYAGHLFTQSKCTMERHYWFGCGQTSCKGGRCLSNQGEWQHVSQHSRQSDKRFTRYLGFFIVVVVHFVFKSNLLIEIYIYQFIFNCSTHNCSPVFYHRGKACYCTALPVSVQPLALICCINLDTELYRKIINILITTKAECHALNKFILGCCYLYWI